MLLPTSLPVPANMRGRSFFMAAKVRIFSRKKSCRNVFYHTFAIFPLCFSHRCLPMEAAPRFDLPRRCFKLLRNRSRKGLARSPKVVPDKSKGCRLQVQRLSSASWKHFHKIHLTNCLSATYKYIQDKSIKTPKSNSCAKSVREKSKCQVGFIRFFYVPLHPSTLCFIIKGLFEHEKQ